MLTAFSHGYSLFLDITHLNTYVRNTHATDTQDTCNTHTHTQLRSINHNRCLFILFYMSEASEIEISTAIIYK